MPEHQTNSAAAPTAVVVNDDTTALNILTGLLQNTGIEARGFDNARDALLEMDLNHPPNLIVTDIYMPGIDGWRFCRLLRSSEYKAFNQVPILVISSTFAGDETSRITADLGANAFLSSPVDGSRFIDTVNSLLAGKQPKNQLQILIVEDSRTQAKVIKKAFENQEYHVTITHTLESATHILEKQLFHVAVIDYHLPDGTGDILLSKFRNLKFKAIQTDVVCIMMTTDPSPELALAWMQQGAAAYVKKPFDPGYLMELCTRARREKALLGMEDLLEMRTQELKESEKRFKALHNASFGGIAIHDKGIILDCNMGLSEISGFSVSELVGMDGLLLIAEQSRKKVMTNILSGYEKSYEVMGVRKDGTEYPLRLEARNLPYNGKDVRAVEFRDITERKQSEEEREKLQTQLNQAQKMESVGRLAGGVAHDFNNMLGVILGRAEMALEDMEENNPLHKDLKEIQNAAQRSADLTKQLLTFARKQIINPKVIDLNNTVEKILKMLRRLIGEHIDLLWKPAKDLWHVRMDPSQIDQILANLCLNARDAIKGVGKITVETGMKTFDKKYCDAHAGFVPGNFVLLAAGDNGCGMDKETLGNLFEPFFTTKEMGNGLGLGLATVYGIVKQNKGFINVYSEPGHGTCVKIYLPQYIPSGKQPLIKPSDKPFPRGDETILLVEDEPSILAMTKMLLERQGYRVLATDTPKQALTLAKEYENKIDLLLTDVVMPEMNGRDLAIKLKSLYPDLKLLFMSGYTANVIAHQGILEKGVHFIQKPFPIKDLAITVSRIMGEK